MLSWVDRDIETEIREILRARGATDLSKEACKEWARRFVQSLASQFPKHPLRPEQYGPIGARFEALLMEARGTVRT